MDEQILKAVFIGIVQGITEFLPVSSSAHLIFFEVPPYLNVALHVGTLSAVLVYFAKDWFAVLQSGARLCAAFTYSKQAKAELTKSDYLPVWLFIGSVPAGVFGLSCESWIEETLHHPAATAIPLAGFGVLLWYVDKYFLSKRNFESIGLRDVIVIGLAQAIALFPGTSRSGVTITAGRYLGLTRESAARFSFLLGTPAMLGAAALKSSEILQHVHSEVFWCGFFASVISGFLAIKFLMQTISKIGLLPFAIYRIALAIIILASVQ